MEIALLAFLVALYFVPGLVANHRGHHNQGAIWILNLFLGWTFIGWVVALVWASTAVQRPTSNQQTRSEPSYQWTPMRMLIAVLMITLFIVIMAIMRGDF